MATHHAEPGEIVNLATWADDLPEEHSKAIAKTPEMELARLFLPPGKGMENHHVHGPLIVHCLSGRIEFDALSAVREMTGGQLAYLPPDERFTIRAREEALVLVTFVFSAPHADHPAGQRPPSTEGLRPGEPTTVLPDR